MLEILATQKNYCAILHILLNFVKNIGTSWFAVVSALRFPGQARAIMPVPPPAGGRIIRHRDVTVTVAAQAAATDSEPGAASPGQALPAGGTAPAGPGAAAVATGPAPADHWHRRRTPTAAAVGVSCYYYDQPTPSRHCSLERLSPGLGIPGRDSEVPRAV